MSEQSDPEQKHLFTFDQVTCLEFELLEGFMCCLETGENLFELYNPEL